jgi:hypothetical protein
MSFIDWFRSYNKFRNVAEWAACFFDNKMAIYDSARIKQIGCKRLMFALSGVPMNVAIAEQSFHGRFLIATSQTDDYDMNVCHTARVTSPCKSAVREADFKASALKKNGPELRHLFALRN